MEEAKKKLAALRERLRYQAQAMMCSLGPEDCREMLVLIDEAEAALSGRCPHCRQKPCSRLLIACASAP